MKHKRQWVKVLKCSDVQALILCTTISFIISGRRSRCRCRRSGNIASMSCTINIGFIHTWIGVGRWCGDALVGSGAVASAGRSFVGRGGRRHRRHGIAYGVLGSRAADEFGDAAGTLARRLDQRAFWCCHFSASARWLIWAILVCFCLDTCNFWNRMRAKTE